MKTIADAVEIESKYEDFIRKWNAWKERQTSVARLKLQRNTPLEATLLIQKFYAEISETYHVELDSVTLARFNPSDRLRKDAEHRLEALRQYIEQNLPPED